MRRIRESYMAKNECEAQSICANEARKYPGPYETRATYEPAPEYPAPFCIRVTVERWNSCD